MVDDRPRTLQDLVQSAMARLSVPGVAVGIVQDGVDEVHVFGSTSIENPLGVDERTLFQVGSITKTFTAMLVMRLVEQGALDLQAPVRHYLPGFRLADERAAEQVIVQHLLTHVGGFVGDHFPRTGDGDDALERFVETLADVAQVAPPGALWSYCNAGFSVAGRLVEVVTGQTFEAAMRTLVLEPLGMQHSYLFPQDVLTHRFVVGHASPFSADEPVRVMRDWPLARATHAAGGLISCVPDLLRCVRFWLGLGPSDVLSERSRQFMLAPLVEAGNFAEACGLAWMLRTIHGVRIVGHGGSTVGQQAQLMLVPERQCGIVSLANSNRGGELHLEVTRWFLRERLGLVEAERPRIELAVAARAEYVGVYEAALNGIEVAPTDDGLRVQVRNKGGFPYADSPPSPEPPASRFVFIGADRIRGLDPPLTDSVAEFVRDGEGRIAWLRIGGRLARRQSP